VINLLRNNAVIDDFFTQSFEGVVQRADILFHWHFQIKDRVSGESCCEPFIDQHDDFARKKLLMKQGLKRMFLHAYSIAFAHPLTGEPMRLVAPLPKELEGFIAKLDAGAGG
jgi:hypothetical protein